MKYCTNCGQELPDQANFCVSCRTEQCFKGVETEGFVYVKKKPGKGFAIAGMVLGIIGAWINLFVFIATIISSGSSYSGASSSYIMIFIYISFYALLAIIFSGVAMSKGYKNGVGKSGMVLGVVSIFVGIVSLAIM